MCGLMVVAMALAWAAPASAAKRVALVVGNDAYANLPTLAKAVNDARAIRGALSDLGFTVILGENLTRREMNRKLADLDASVQAGDTVFFFYAGHGVAIGQENFLLPVDTPAPKDGEQGLIRDEAHEVGGIINRIHGRGAATTMMVLDACRDNPFVETGTRSIGLSRGLTKVEAPAGVFVLYSAGIGQKALDRLSASDADANSVFTRKLVPLLRSPGLNHVNLAKRVQREVDELAATVHHAQQPAYYDQIIGEIVLNPATDETSTQATTSEPAASQATVATGQISEAAAAWRAIENTTSTAVLEAYVSRYTGTVFADIANARLGELKSAQAAAPAEPPVKSASLATEAPAVPEASGETAATDPALAVVDPAAASVPAASEPPAVDVSDDPVALAMSVQLELKRVGCYLGSVDGEWGPSSERALTTFGARANYRFTDDTPAAVLLTALRAQKQPVCESSCRPGYVVEAGACVKSTVSEPRSVRRECKTGLVRNADGNCVKKRVQQAAEPVQQPTKSQSAKKQTTKKQRVAEPEPAPKRTKRRVVEQQPQDEGGGGAVVVFGGRKRSGGGGACGGIGIGIGGGLVLGGSNC
jgi:uncharacterized caspase-like protein